MVSGHAPILSVSLQTLGNPGSWGDGLNIPQITVDEHGRVTDVQTVAIPPLDLSGYAPLDSPAFTGLPTVPLAPLADSTALALDAMGDPRAGSLRAAGEPDLHRHTVRTDAAAGYQHTDLATCAFVQNAIAMGASITVGETPPVGPRPNQLWWHSGFGQMFIFYSDANTSQWVPASPAMASAAIPPGSGQDFFGGSVPTGWYLCDGSLKIGVRRAAVPAIGTTYGAGDGSTTFALPDCRGRVLAMRDYATGRLTQVADSVGAWVASTRSSSRWRRPAVHTHGGSVTVAGRHTHQRRRHPLQRICNGKSAVGRGDGTNYGTFASLWFRRIRRSERRYRRERRRHGA